MGVVITAEDIERTEIRGAEDRVEHRRRGLAPVLHKWAIGVVNDEPPGSLLAQVHESSALPYPRECFPKRLARLIPYSAELGVLVEAVDRVRDRLHEAETEHQKAGIARRVSHELVAKLPRSMNGLRAVLKEVFVAAPLDEVV